MTVVFLARDDRLCAFCYTGCTGGGSSLAVIEFNSNDNTHLCEEEIIGIMTELGRGKGNKLKI